jgi:CubicO group peptidase (beta-lactamase class C family)
MRECAKVLCATAVVVGLVAADALGDPPGPWPTKGWPVADPGSQGLSSEPLDRFVVSSTLVGIAIERGMIRDLSLPLLEFFPQVRPIENLDDRKRAITLEHVLRMRLGMAWRELELPYEDPQNSLRRLNGHDGDWYEFVLDSPMANAPGERHLYNSGGAILLAGVLEHATGERADEFARRTLFDPLGVGDTRWTVVRGVTHTGGGLSMSARDMAKIGYLYLRDGIWDGVRILPEGWVSRATEGPVEAAAPGQTPIGYGLMWWLLPGPEDVEKQEATASIYAAWGHMGQFIIIAPEYDLVFVTTGGANDFADEVRPIECLYDYILPAATSSIPFVDPPAVVPSAAQEHRAPAAGAGPSVPTFEMAIGGPNTDRGVSAIATSDGGFAAGREDVYIIRVDPEGNTTHSATFGGDGNDCGWAIRQLDDGRFVVAGFTDSFGAGGVDAYLVRTDAAGDTLWTRTYGGPRMMSSGTFSRWTTADSCSPDRPPAWERAISTSI